MNTNTATPSPSPMLRPVAANATITPDVPPLKAAAAATTPSNRCPCCRKKLALTDMACRCGIRHCQSHRLPEDHACPHDFKAQGRAVLAAQLERCVGAKVEKI